MLPRSIKTEEVMSSSDVDSPSQTETEDTDIIDNIKSFVFVSHGNSHQTHKEHLSSTESSYNDKFVSTSNISELEGAGEQTDSSASGEVTVHKNMNISVDLSNNSDIMDESMSTQDEHNLDQTSTAHRSHSENRTFLLSHVDFSNPFEWYKSKCFQPYWDHYHHAMNWCRKHYQVSKTLQSTHAKQQVPLIGSQYHPPHGASWFHPNEMMTGNVGCKTEPQGVQKNGSEWRTHVRRLRRRRQKERERLSESSNAVSPTGGETETSEEFQMEITQEMMDFFAKSQEHRKQREEEKSGKGQDSNVKEHINAEDVRVNKDRTPTVEAPKERPGARRTAEMKLLYGKGAAMIHGMETALQMSFDRNTDIKQPKVWPNMPLRIVFG